MLTKKERILIIVIIIAILITGSCYLTYSIVSEKMLKETKDLVGTYGLFNDSKNSAKEEYLYIYRSDNSFSFGKYNSDGDVLEQGRCASDCENSISLVNDHENFGTLIYSNEKYYYVENNHRIIQVTKISDSAILP